MSEPQISLDDRLKDAQIEKLRAETDAARRKPTIWQSNWLPILAAILASTSGLAAVISSVAQLTSTNQRLAMDRAVVAAQQEMNKADSARLSAQERLMDIDKEVARRVSAAEAAERKAVADTQRAQQEVAKLERIRSDNMLFITQLKNTADASQSAVLAAKADLHSAGRGPASVAAPDARAKSVLASLAAAPGRLVYLQYLDSGTGTLLKGLQTQLTKAGYVAPGTEQLDARHFKGVVGEVRFFRRDDSGEADKIASIANQYLAGVCPAAPPVIARQIATSKTVTKLELWLGFACPPATRK